MRQNKAIRMIRFSMNEAELKNVNIRKAANRMTTMPTIKKGSAILILIKNAEARTFDSFFLGFLRKQKSYFEPG